MTGNEDLLDKVCAYETDSGNTGRMFFAEHLSQTEMQDGIRTGKYKKGVFQVNSACFSFIFLCLTYHFYLE